MEHTQEQDPFQKLYLASQKVSKKEEVICKNPVGVLIARDAQIRERRYSSSQPLVKVGGR